MFFKDSFVYVFVRPLKRLVRSIWGVGCWSVLWLELVSHNSLDAEQLTLSCAHALIQTVPVAISSHYVTAPAWRQLKVGDNARLGTLASLLFRLGGISSNHAYNDPPLARPRHLNSGPLCSPPPPPPLFMPPALTKNGKARTRQARTWIIHVWLRGWRMLFPEG